MSWFASNNKLLSGVILVRVTPGVTWIQPYIYVSIFLLDPIPFAPSKGIGDRPIKFCIIIGKIS